MLNMNEIKGGSPYGAGTLAGGDGKREPSKLEEDIATFQGEYFAKLVRTMCDGKNHKL